LKIALVHPFPDPVVHGLRVLRAILRAEGHDVVLVHMGDATGLGVTSTATMGRRRYSRRVLDRLVGITCDADLVGVAVMTNFVQAAVEITSALRRARPDRMIAWGGVHASLRPDECLDHADVVLVGEAEHSLPELVRHLEAREDWTAVRGLCFRDGRDLVHTPAAPLAADLDLLPHPDLDPIGQWALLGGQLLPLDIRRTHRLMGLSSVSAEFGVVAYQTMTSRGCPNACSYCANAALSRLAPSGNYLRYRSVESVIDECAATVHRFGFVDYMWFSDDVFLSRPLRELERFAELYRRRVGLPFYMLVSPTTVDDDRYRVMVEAGLQIAQMGIQSASPRTLALYNRSRMSPAAVRTAAATMHAHVGRTLPPIYDVLIDNPWETNDDLRATIRLIASLPRPHRLRLFSLVLFPGTALNDRARAEGLLVDEVEDVQHHMFTRRNADTYHNLLLVSQARGLLSRRLAGAATSPRLDPLLHSRPAQQVGQAFCSVSQSVRRTIDRLLDLRATRAAGFDP